MLLELNQDPNLIRNAQIAAYLILLCINCVGTIAAGAAVLWGIGKLVVPDANEAHEQMWDDLRNDRR
ncbi:MAG: hypothetical protein UU93_C0001G0115 [Candidatus Amesbacteria bacterium GW2011_GWA2_42_12]|uniref:Uncharacterized protein n=1 Tax=Candidatus Amesbacteria bacterium GW2011_GWA2_42_12 TaxID=1618356 RepID=A0A0G0Y9D5_9BACT|nr:MAG: hypothetical protein UU93_C0001G0115 [Candidatus Amesbacteria bacterium GW2011_GWA2_42_12]